MTVEIGGNTRFADPMALQPRLRECSSPFAPEVSEGGLGWPCVGLFLLGMGCGLCMPRRCHLRRCLGGKRRQKSRSQTRRRTSSSFEALINSRSQRSSCTTNRTRDMSQSPHHGRTSSSSQGPERGPSLGRERDTRESLQEIRQRRVGSVDSSRMPVLTTMMAGAQNRRARGSRLDTPTKRRRGLSHSPRSSTEGSETGRLRQTSFREGVVSRKPGPQTRLRAVTQPSTMDRDRSRRQTEPCSWKILQHMEKAARGKVRAGS